jgi:hypothetical protein
MSGILQIPMQVPGMVGVFPNQKFMLTTDNLAAVTAAGYLNNVSGEANPVSSTDIIQCMYSFNQQTGVGTYALFTVTITNGVITLVQWAGDSGVVVPTIVGHIATYVDTNGTISEDAASAINGGNIQAGLSGTAGFLASFPATASKGSLHLTAVASTGDTVTTISNVAMGQASVVSIPDPANAIGRFLVGATATPFVSGNFPMNSGTGGLMVDSGVPVSSLATTTNAVLLTPAADQTITIHNLIIAQGNLVAGSSGHAGTVSSFPGTAANGSLILAGVNAGGAFTTTISNSTMGQSSVVNIPDPGNAIGQFLVGATATPFTTGHILSASGTAGIVADSGIVATNVQLKTQVKAVLTGNIGGAGAGPLTITVAGMTAASVVVVTVSSSSNACYALTAVAGSGSFALTMNADPGATLIVNYIAYIAAQ